MNKNTKPSEAKKINPIDRLEVISTLKSVCPPYEPFRTPYKLTEMIGLLSDLWEDEDEL